MSYRIISADCHIDMTWMPGDLWVKNAPARFRDQVPQVRQTPDGPRWYAEEKELGVFGGLGFGFDRVQRGFSKHSSSCSARRASAGSRTSSIGWSTRTGITSSTCR